jgi:hypothetical protein
VQFHEKYFDVLQNMEFAVIQVYNSCSGLRDSDVMTAYEALMDHYKAEKIGREPRDYRLSERSELVFNSVRDMCEWRLGRESPFSFEGEEEAPPGQPKTVDEILECLKKLRKSAEKWSRRGGVDGYLRFVSQFVK